MNEELRPESKTSPWIDIPDDFKGYPLKSFHMRPYPAECLESVLIPGGLLQDRIEAMAYDIATDLANQPFVALCVLRGGYQFFNDLLDKIKQFYRYQSSSESMSRGNSGETVDSQQIRIEFIRVKSYVDGNSTNLKIIGIESLDSLRGKNVLIVEDIIDTGNTMSKLLEELKSYQLKSIRVACLSIKRTSLSNGYIPDYVGFSIPDKFIVGCNYEYNDYFRDLNHVCVISEIGKEMYSAKNLNKIKGT